MRHYSLIFSAFIGTTLVGHFAMMGCGGANGGSGFGSGNGGGSGGVGSSNGGGNGSNGGGNGSGGGSGSGSGGGFGTSSSGGSSGGYVGDGGVPCPAGLQCNVTCSGGGDTTISGKVFDPAGKNPLYNIVVYVPATPLQPLPAGVPMGSDSCSCTALFKSGALTSATTGVDGSFQLKNAPVGSSVPLVVQVGKWRHQVNINVTQCQDNPQMDGSLKLPGTVQAGTNDNMPDIAVSTGGADTLECLMTRIGIPGSEYVAGAGTGGHIHIFNGGNMGGGGGLGGLGGIVGAPEANPMPNAPASDMALWNSASSLMPYDITLLSCEGGETWDANPANLETYLNAGGRVFASHYHYSWFSGPLDSTCTGLGGLTGTCNMYTAPSDWGNNLATWAAGANGGGMGGGGLCGGSPVSGVVQTTLNGSGMMFPKGQALQQWLGNVNALGQGGVPATDLSIYQPRYNSVVGSSNIPSQPWINSSNMGTNQTMYFSFDTPVNLMPPTTGPDPSGGPTYCGRAVFSDLHVAGDPSTCGDNMTSPPPGGCVQGDLSPQEKALEFMLFDLSSCVIPDTVAPPTTIPPTPQ
jgi:hypothetical protein